MTEPSSGVVLQPVDGPGEFCGMVAEIESLGLRHLWLTDSSLHARNCYSYLTLAATRSSRLLLGTAVTNPATRHPAITAAAAATVDEVSGGRMILGIGAGDRPLLALGFQPSPLATLEAAISGIRRLWHGEEVDLQSPGFTMSGAHLRFPARAGIPVFVSASGPRTLELAGRVADGVILLVGLFPEALDWAVSQVERGAETAGRPRPHIAVFAYGAIDEDEHAALESARSIAAWFPPDRAPHLRPGGPAARPGRPGPGRLLRRRVPGGGGRRRGCSRTSSCARSRSRVTASTRRSGSVPSSPPGPIPCTSSRWGPSG